MTFPFADMVTHLKTAPDTQLDAAMRPLIEKWSNPPKAIEVLEVLDHSIHSALGSGFVIKLLQIMYEEACKAENTTHEEVVKDATWRNLGQKE